MTIRPLLSICIPTYNRENLLRENLALLLSCEEFDDEVELVISDNCSTDSTKNVVKSFIEKYPNKRIIYNRNEENIRDKNFLKTLSFGTGDYLKLLNDYTCLSNEDIAIMKRLVAENAGTRPLLLFYKELRCKAKLYENIKLHSIDSFVRLVNNKMTWISNFGCWRERLNDLYQFEIHSDLQLLQVFWTLYLLEQSLSAIVVNMNYSTLDVHDKNRTSYNFFKVHVDNYYKILNHYCNRGLVTRKTIRYDKYRILSDFVGSSIVHYLVLRKESSFVVRDSWQIIIRNFKTIPFFYILPFYEFCIRVYKKMVRICLVLLCLKGA